MNRNISLIIGTKNKRLLAQSGKKVLDEVFFIYKNIKLNYVRVDVSTAINSLQHGLIDSVDNVIKEQLISPNISSSITRSIDCCRLYSKEIKPTRLIKTSLDWTKLASHLLAYLLIIILFLSIVLFPKQRKLLTLSNTNSKIKKLANAINCWFQTISAILSVNNNKPIKSSITRWKLIHLVSLVWLVIFTVTSALYIYKMSNGEPYSPLNNIEQLKTWDYNLLEIRTESCKQATLEVVENTESYKKARKIKKNLSVTFGQIYANDPGKYVLITWGNVDTVKTMACFWAIYPKMRSHFTENPIHISSPFGETLIPLIYSKVIESKKQQFLQRLGYSFLENGFYYKNLNSGFAKLLKGVDYRCYHAQRSLIPNAAQIDIHFFYKTYKTLAIFAAICTVFHFLLFIVSKFAK